MNEKIRVNELSEKTKVSKATIWRWIKEGKLKSYKIGAKITVLDVAEVNQALGLNIIDNNQVQGA